MRSNANFRQTRMLVTKLIRLTIETGSVTGIYSALLAIATRLTLHTSSSCRLSHRYPVFCLSSQNLLRRASPHRPQAVCQYCSRGTEFAIPNYGWAGYLYIIN